MYFLPSEWSREPHYETRIQIYFDLLLLLWLHGALLSLIIIIIIIIIMWLYNQIRALAPLMEFRNNNLFTGLDC
jgi:hypothetical protein